jgi:hypothetical protein
VTTTPNPEVEPVKSNRSLVVFALVLVISALAAVAHVADGSFDLLRGAPRSSR